MQTKPSLPRGDAVLAGKLVAARACDSCVLGPGCRRSTVSGSDETHENNELQHDGKADFLLALCLARLGEAWLRSRIKRLKPM
jgi:hypothetical protein